MDTTADIPMAETASPWGAVICMTLMTFVLVASEFMPVSLLTPIAEELAITEGQAGMAISISGFFAVVTSLFSNGLLARLDRRTVILIYTAVLVLSGIAVTFAPNYLIFMFGRALIGVSIGGFWSLSTAIIARIVSKADVPKALAMLQGGTALAAVIAAPLGSFLGGLIGWRGAFFIVVPIGIAAFVWQALVLPSMPGGGTSSPARAFRLLGNRSFALGMAAMTLFFMGQFALSTYLRPFLEGVTGLGVNTLSLVLLSIGLAGLAGTSLIGFLLRAHLSAVLVAFPAALALIALAFDRPRAGRDRDERTSDPLGPSYHPHPGGLGYLDDPRRPRPAGGRRRLAGCAHPVRHHRRRLFRWAAVRQRRLVDPVRLGCRPSPGIGRHRSGRDRLAQHGARLSAPHTIERKAIC